MTTYKNGHSGTPVRPIRIPIDARIATDWHQAFMQSRTWRATAEVRTEPG